MKCTRRVALLSFFKIALALNSTGQSLKLDELTKLFDMSPVETNEFLSLKAWQIIDTKEGTDSTYAQVVWGVNNSQGALIGQYVLYYDRGLTQATQYFTSVKSYNDAIKQRITQYKLAKGASQVVANGFCQDFSGSRFKISHCVLKNNDLNRTEYSFRLELKPMTAYVVTEDGTRAVEMPSNVYFIWWEVPPRTTAYVREQADPNAAIIDTLNGPETVVISDYCTECGEDFYRVERRTIFGGDLGFGYVKREFVRRRETGDGIE